MLTVVGQPLTERSAAELRAIATKIRKQQREATKLLLKGENAAAKEIIKLIKQMREEIKRILRDTPTENFKAFHLNRLLAEIDNSINHYSNLLNTTTQSGVTKSYQAGKTIAELNLTSMKVPPVIIHDEMLGIIQGLSAELVTGLTDATRKQVRASIQRAVLGEKTPYEAARDMDNIFGATADSGISYRAERIIRTEYNRAFNAADEEYRYSLKQAGAEMKKMWVSARDGRVRPAHEEADGQIVDADEPFIVDGEELDYPLDPHGSAGNTINCRCTTITFPAELEDEFASA